MYKGVHRIADPNKHKNRHLDHLHTISKRAAMWIYKIPGFCDWLPWKRAVTSVRRIFRSADKLFIASETMLYQTRYVGKFLLSVPTGPPKSTIWNYTIGIIIDVCSQRIVKFYFQPSSSGRAAEVLMTSGGAITGFQGFDSISDLGYVPFGFGTDDADSSVDADFRMVLRKFSKRDVTTKLKVCWLLTWCFGTKVVQLIQPDNARCQGKWW